MQLWNIVIIVDRIMGCQPAMALNVVLLLVEVVLPACSEGHDEEEYATRASSTLGPGTVRMHVFFCFQFG